MWTKKKSWTYVLCVVLLSIVAVSVAVCGYAEDDVFIFFDDEIPQPVKAEKTPFVYEDTTTSKPVVDTTTIIDYTTPKPVPTEKTHSSYTDDEVAKPVKTSTPKPESDRTSETTTDNEVPKPVETPTPKKTATPKPEKTPTPKPEKTPTPKPEKTPTPKPAKTPTPKPAKTPTPKPAKTPTPKPVKTPTPKPENSSNVCLHLAYYDSYNNDMKYTDNQDGKTHTWQNGYDRICSKCGIVLEVVWGTASGDKGSSAHVRGSNGKCKCGYKYETTIKAPSGNYEESSMEARIQNILNDIAEGRESVDTGTDMSVGNKFTGTNAQYQCKGYAQNVYKIVFDIMPSKTKPQSDGLNYQLNAQKDMEMVGSIVSDSTAHISADEISELMQNARPGDFVQIRRNHGGSHSAIVYSVDETGITFLEANTDNMNTVMLNSYTWSTLEKKNAAMSLYTATEYKTK